MANNHHSQPQPHTNGLLQDAQGRWYEMLSPTQVLTEEQELEARIVKRKKKCHGNRKLQHFKRKCRARRLTEDQITTRIQNRSDTIPEQLLTDQAIPERTHESSKRKRDDPSIEKSLNSSMKSISQLSISQTGVPKKVKISTIQTMSSNTDTDSQTNSKNYML